MYGSKCWATEGKNERDANREDEWSDKMSTSEEV